MMILTYPPGRLRIALTNDAYLPTVPTYFSTVPTGGHRAPTTLSVPTLQDYAYQRTDIITVHPHVKDRSYNTIP